MPACMHACISSAQAKARTTSSTRERGRSVATQQQPLQQLLRPGRAGCLAFAALRGRAADLRGAALLLFAIVWRVVCDSVSGGWSAVDCCRLASGCSLPPELETVFADVRRRPKDAIVEKPWHTLLTEQHHPIFLDTHQFLDVHLTDARLTSSRHEWYVWDLFASERVRASNRKEVRTRLARQAIVSVHWLRELVLRLSSPNGAPLALVPVISGAIRNSIAFARERLAERLTTHCACAQQQLPYVLCTSTLPRSPTSIRSRLVT